MKRTGVLVALACAFVLCASFAVAADRPHEGKVISIDKDAMMLTVQGDKDDQWVLSWTPSTKLKGDVTVAELKVGDAVHFEFTEKDGKKWLTELKRTDRAKG